MIKIKVAQFKPEINIITTIREQVYNGIETIVKNVHGSFVRNAPVDTGYLRNAAVYSINGNNAQGYNSMKTTSPTSVLWEHKRGARPIGDAADQIALSDLIQFPKNMDKNKIVGYVGSNVNNGKNEPYDIYQEYGSVGVAPQPFFRPAIFFYGSGNDSLKTFKNAIKIKYLGPMNKVKEYT